jgi:integrase
VASFRKLPSGKWQATVRLPGGKRTTRTDPLKRVVADWAREAEAEAARGVWRDPRAGRITVGEWHAKWWAARVVEDETRRGDAGCFKNHVLPHWEEWPLAKIRRTDVQSWVRILEKSGTGRAAIKRSYNLFVSLLGDAVMEGSIASSPCLKIDLPPSPPKLPSWFTREQVDRIQAELPAGHAAMVELMVHTGLRWGEAAAVVGGERDDGTGNPVDWLRGRIVVDGTMSQHGRWKAYPKSEASCREVPVPRDVLDLMSPLLSGRAADGWVFVTSRRAPGRDDPATLSGANWRVRWDAAIETANKKIATENKANGTKTRPTPSYTPHACRHTAASWLVQEGVPLYDVQALLGHKSFATTQIYSHLAPDAHGAVQKAWQAIAAHQRRTTRSTEGGSDA